MSLRDILYHVAWYEREMIELLQLRALVGSPWWKLPVNERNDYIKTEGQSVSLLQAWRLEQQFYSELQAQLDTLRDEELNDAGHFRKCLPITPGGDCQQYLRTLRWPLTDIF
jgi:hypothetical protein